MRLHVNTVQVENNYFPYQKYDLPGEIEFEIDIIFSFYNKKTNNAFNTTQK